MNNDWSPKVSIIIPVYNGSNFLKCAVDSALAQTYKNVEIIVVNDGSSDDGKTEEIALSYGNKIKYISKENGGVSSALNLGINSMTGDYFSWLSHDDLYLPDKVKNQVESIKKNGENKTISLCGHSFIDEIGCKLKKNACRYFENGLYGWDEVLTKLLILGAFNGCALLIPKHVFDECGGFHEGLRYSQDALMWDTIFLKGYSLVYNDDKDVLSRIHGKQLTQTGRSVFQKDSNEIGKILIPELIKASDSKNNFLFYFAKRNAKNGNVNVVKMCIENGKKNRLIGIWHVVYLTIESIYGQIRPFLRKLYYKYLVRVKI